jgi:hypothetical protein
MSFGQFQFSQQKNICAEILQQPAVEPIEEVPRVAENCAIATGGGRGGDGGLRLSSSFTRMNPPTSSNGRKQNNTVESAPSGGFEGIEEDEEAIPAGVGAEGGAADDGTWMAIEMNIKRAKLEYYNNQVSRIEEENCKHEFCKNLLVNFKYIS